MEQKINIAELLKDCPSGMELDCTMMENVYFDEVLTNSIKCYYIKNGTKIRNTVYFNKFGEYFSIDNAKCAIFPKGKTTWEGFQRPFKDGDIIYVESKSYSPGLISIYKKEDSQLFYDYCAVGLDGKSFYLDSIYGLIQKDKIAISRLATEEEKQKLFQTIKANGYKWNPESKTLEKLVEPSFLEEETNQENVGTKIELTGFMQMGKTASVIFNNENYEDEVELQFRDYKIEFRDGKTYAVRKKSKYPKTYKECLAILNYNIGRVSGYKASLLAKLQDLLVCRDAYWKIYGEQMGLDGPWKPDFNSGHFIPAIVYKGGFIQKVEIRYSNAILAFPTEEMRNNFKENFEQDIEICKELL